MGTNKLYFSELDDEYAYTKNHLLEQMTCRDLSELQVFEAKRELHSDYFFCRSIGEIMEKSPIGEACGKNCESYDPRNKKSGCCKHRGFCYTPGPESKLTYKL